MSTTMRHWWFLREQIDLIQQQIKDKLWDVFYIQFCYGTVYHPIDGVLTEIYKEVVAREEADRQIGLKHKYSDAGIKIQKILNPWPCIQNDYVVSMAKDQFFFFKLIGLVLVAFFAGINLVVSGWLFFVINMVFAILLSVGMANSYDRAWDK